MTVVATSLPRKRRAPEDAECGGNNKNDRIIARIGRGVQPAAGRSVTGEPAPPPCVARSGSHTRVTTPP